MIWARCANYLFRFFEGRLLRLLAKRHVEFQKGWTALYQSNPLRNHLWMGQSWTIPKSVQRWMIACQAALAVKLLSERSLPDPGSTSFERLQMPKRGWWTKHVVVPSTMMSHKTQRQARGTIPAYPQRGLINACSNRRTSHPSSKRGRCWNQIGQSYWIAKQRRSFSISSQSSG